MNIIEVIDTAVKIGLGALVGGISAYSLDRLKQKNEMNRERRARFQDRIVLPIIAFIDELLICISETYWSSIDHVESSAGTKMIALRNKEGVIESRVAALNDQQLSAKFRELTTKRIEIGNLLYDRKISEAHEKMNKVFELAGQILLKLHKKELFT